MDGADSLIGAISGINDVAAPDFNEVLTGKMRTWLRTTISDALRTQQSI
jgi:hypothetical protein